MTRRLERSSELAAPRAAVWARVTTMEGVNAELAPLLRMTAPAGARDIATLPLGRRAFRSWLLLLGAIPIDYDDLTLVELDPGRRFLERSRLFSARTWEHERTLEDLPGGGTRITDRLAFVPRVRALGRAHERIVAAAFDRRHRALRRQFGDAGPTTGSRSTPG